MVGLRDLKLAAVAATSKLLVALSRTFHARDTRGRQPIVLFSVDDVTRGTSHFKQGSSRRPNRSTRHT